ncbi:hypothetical protein Tco_0540014 [Tanacetum coccineum]
MHQHQNNHLPPDLMHLPNSKAKISKSITPPFKSASKEDNDPEQAQRDKDIQKNLALITKYFKKIYKPTNNNLRTSSNSINKNVDTSPRQHSEQPESISNTCVVEKVDSNVIPDSPDMCDNDIQTDQNAEDERVALANLIANLKLDVDENKKIQKQLKKANTSLAHELKECKSILAETSRTLGESNSIRDSCLIALQNKQTELETYKTLNDRTVDYDKLERKLNETLGLLAQKEIDIKEGLKLKAYEISVVKEKHDELVKQSLLTKSHYEGLVKEKTKVITDLKLKEEKDIDKMISMEKQLKFLNEIIYKRNQSIQTIHMIAPKAQHSMTHHEEETLTLEKESRSKLNKDKVRPELVDQAWEKHSHDHFRAPTAHDMKILIKTCLMPLAIKTQNDSFTFVHELKQEMHADLKYVESLENEIDELESNKQCKEQMKNDNVCKEIASNVFQKERKQYHEIQYLKAQLQDKNIAISELKKLIEKCKGKYVETKFNKPSVVRQPNAQRIPKPSVLGKPAPFSDSLERKSFLQTKSVPKTNVSESLSKPIITQILPQTARQSIRNTNVIKAGMYQINTRTTQSLAPKLPQTSRNTNPSMSNVSRPQLRSTQIKDKVVPNNSQVKFKKTEVEDHHRISSISNKTKSVTACNDSLKSTTSNVNAICATCGKCVFNSNHDACVSKFLNDVNARTKKPKIVQLILFIVDSGCTKHMTGNLKLLCNFIEKYLGTVHFGNDQFAPILGYRDLVQGNITINKVYYVEGLYHNLFSVGQFYDADLEVAFRKSTCFVRDL